MQIRKLKSETENSPHLPQSNKNSEPTVGGLRVSEEKSI